MYINLGNIRTCTGPCIFHPERYGHCIIRSHGLLIQTDITVFKSSIGQPISKGICHIQFFCVIPTVADINSFPVNHIGNRIRIAWEIQVRGRILQTAGISLRKASAWLCLAEQDLRDRTAHSLSGITTLDYGSNSFVVSRNVYRRTCIHY